MELVTSLNLIEANVTGFLAQISFLRRAAAEVAMDTDFEMSFNRRYLKKK